MLTIFETVTAYEICPDISRRGQFLVDQMLGLGAHADNGDEEDLIKRRTIETLGYQLVAEARAAHHPLTVDPPAFWRTWAGFCIANGRLEAGAANRPPGAGQDFQAPPLPSSRCHIGASLPSPSVGAGAVAAQPVDAEARGHAFNGGLAGDPSPGESNMTLSAALDLLLKQRSIADGDGRAREDVGIVVQFVIDLVGDIPLAEIDVALMMRVENALPDIPKPNKIPKRHNTSLHSRWLYAQDNGWEGLQRCSAKTVLSGRHRCLHAFFKWCREKGLASVPDYRFALVSKDNPDEQDRDAWREDEILKLFGLPLFTGCRSIEQCWQPGKFFVQSHLYWAYLIIFFMGLRPSEIGTIKISEVVEHDGIWYFDFTPRAKSGTERRSMKTQASLRKIPIHPLLIDLGLLERHPILKSLDMVMLFPDWKAYVHKRSGRTMWGHEFSKSWQYVRRRFNFDRQELTLYGGRHTRATWYDEAGIPDRIRNRVLGHVPQTPAQRYGSVHLTDAEARLVLKLENQTQVKVARMLLAAKKAADTGEVSRVSLETLIKRADRKKARVKGQPRVATRGSHGNKRG